MKSTILHAMLIGLALLLALATSSCAPAGDDDDAATVTPRPQEPAPVRTETLFRLPLADAEGSYSGSYVIGFDHDPTSYEGIGAMVCMNYMGQLLPFCYDDHKGSDFTLAGGFDTMNLGTAFVYAAADGTVTEVEDGHYDRCHVDTENLGAGNISCDGNEIKANFIRLQHQFGLSTLYYHLRKNSMLVQVGDEVKCGDRLALVGSAGISSFPHLHFQVENEAEEALDPFAGPQSQEKSYWVRQDGGNGLPAEECQNP